MATPARRACNRAAKACAKAHEALADLMAHLPDSVHDRAARQLSELGHLADYLETCTWPDNPA
jgi:hypothetical protein